MPIKLNPIFRLILERFFKWEKSLWTEKNMLLLICTAAIQRKKKKRRREAAWPRTGLEKRRKKNREAKRLWDKLKRCHFTPYFFCPVVTILFFCLFAELFERCRHFTDGFFFLRFNWINPFFYACVCMGGCVTRIWVFISFHFRWYFLCVHSSKSARLSTSLMRCDPDSKYIIPVHFFLTYITKIMFFTSKIYTLLTVIHQ